MLVYKASLDLFEEILKVRSLDMTAPMLIALSSEIEVIKDQLSRLKLAIEGTTRFISELFLCMSDDSPIACTPDASLYNMYLTCVIKPLEEKITSQRELEQTLSKQPYGPYFDFFRAEGAKHAPDASKPFPMSEIEGLESVSEASFTDRVVYRL